MPQAVVVGMNSHRHLQIVAAMGISKGQRTMTKEPGGRVDITLISKANGKP